VTDDLGAEHVYQQQLTALAEPTGGWTTYYVSSSSGNDNNDGLSPEYPLATFVAGIARTGPGVRVLFKRGEVFPVATASDGYIRANGPGLIGAYGEGVAPVIQRQHDQPTINGRDHSDWRIVDLDIPGGGLRSYNAIYDVGDNALILGCRMSGMFEVAIMATHPYQLVQDCVFDGCFYGWFSSYGTVSVPIRCLAILGCQFINGAGSHAIRNYSSKLVVAYCEFADNTGAHPLCLKLCGNAEPNPTLYAVAMHNLFGSPGNVQYCISIGPENNVSTTTQRTEQVVIDSNVWSASYVNCISSSGANRVTIRNNVFLEEGGIAIANGGGVPDFSTWNCWYIYNNTHVYTGTGWTKFLQVLEAATTVEAWDVRNNLIDVPNNADTINTRLMKYSAPVSAIAFDYNLSWAPNVGTPYMWQGTSQNFATWQGVPNDLHGQQVDPQLAGPANGDVRPTIALPAQALPFVRHDADDRVRSLTAPRAGALESP
jgi:hypothetical protein